MSNIQSSCAYCGVGCGISLTPSAKSSIGFELEGDMNHPANKGQLCAKGERLLESLAQPNTLRYPQLKSGKPVEWSEAISTIADTFKQTIAEFGADSVAFYLSGQLLTEDYYVANKLAKGFIGTSNVDTNSRLCMSSAVSAHMRAFGEDVVAGCYDDFEQAEVIVLVGANTAWTHPVLFQRMIKARQLNGTKIVVIDPAKTATASQADLHLQIAPGTDTLLFNGLLNFIANNDSLNQPYIDAHTENFAQTLVHVASQSADFENLAKDLLVSTSELSDFYQLFIDNDKVMTASCQGVNQSVSGTDTTNAMINCHLALGHMGQAGSGFLSLTGQPNAMGGREVGGLATQLACHMGFSEPERQLLGDFWQSDVIAQNKGLTAVELFDAMAEGKIKALWIMGTNPLVSMPNTPKITQALETCPFVVVSEITQDSTTAQMADVLLPAQGWSEKCGTVTNSERVITRQRGFIAAKGAAKADWWALAEVAKAMGFEQSFSFNNSAAVFKEFAQLSKTVKQAFPQKQFDLSGLAELTDAQYDDLLPTQWPVAQSRHIGLHSQRMYADGVFSTASGKAQFIETTTQSTLSPLNETQVRLNSGRSRDQWHTMTRTGHVASLRASIPEPVISLHPSTLNQLNLAEDDFVAFRENLSLSSASLAVSNRPVARVVADDNQTLDMAFMSMHWSNQFSMGQGVNVALDSQFDPHSKQPAFKGQPVELIKVPLALQGVIFGIHDPKLQGVNWNVQQTLSAGTCHHIGFEDADAGFAFQSSLHSLKWTVRLATQQIIHVQCNVNKSQLVSLKLLSETKVAVSLEPLHLLIGQTVNVALMGQLHQLIKAGNSPLICACTGVTEANIQDAMLQKLDDSVFNKRASSLEQSTAITHSDFVKALDETQTELGCGRQCGSCHSEVTQCAKDIWNIGLADIAAQLPEQERKSTQEEVA
ncbi:nitrate reductase [Shewanella donghaensis]|uniref:nitrate reductase n=1 Tax=Shewanella donghaensis TaxID=238836 RepID=UPI001182B446|nr:molybdopterin-dependent oxidoreductase [Shewanella donghaensis]